MQSGTEIYTTDGVLAIFGARLKYPQIERILGLRTIRMLEVCGGSRSGMGTRCVALETDNLII